MSAASGGPGASLADVVNGGGRAGGVFGRGVIGLSRNSGGSGHGQGQGGGNGPSGGHDSHLVKVSSALLK